MAGEVKRIIDQIIQQRSKGNPTVAQLMETKLILRGVDPAQFDETSEDDEDMIQTVTTIAQEMNVTL